MEASERKIETRLKRIAAEVRYDLLRRGTPPMVVPPAGFEGILNSYRILRAADELDIPVDRVVEIDKTLDYTLGVGHV